MIYTTRQLNINTEDIASKVMKLKPFWVSRSNDFIFHTLGSCAYIDKQDPFYKENARLLNPLLRQEFKGLYDEVAGFLTMLLGDEVTLDEKLAHPSFHIIQSNEYATKHGGSWHMDLPQFAVGINEPQQITFTLPIKLPTGGAGIEYADTPDKVEYLEYKEGHIIVHDGKTFHRIAPLKECVPGEFRITLQGHVIKQNGKLNMFW